jgi:hypothetical protein
MKRKIKATQAPVFVAQQAQHLLKKTGPTGPSRNEEKRNEKRDIPVKNGIPQMRTDKCSTVFDPTPGSLRPVFGLVSVYPGKNENGRENGIRLRLKRDSSRPFSSLDTATAMTDGQRLKVTEVACAWR